MPRAFLAVRPPDAVLDAIETRCGAVVWPDAARRTRREQWHITVQFFGDDADLDALAGALGDLEFAPFDVMLSGAGTLPPERRSKLVVLYLREGRDRLAAVAADVAARVAPLGHEPDHDEFTPHLTLARFRRPQQLRRVCEAFGPEPVEPAWRVDELVLYESRLGAGPAVHTARGRFPVRDT